MATIFYLKDTTDYVTNAPTSEQSTALPSGSDVSLAWAVRDMDPTAAASPVTLTMPFNAEVVAQCGLFRTFTSPPLAAQTIAAQTWTISADAKVNNTRLDIHWVMNLYVWRPSGPSKVGSIYDSSTQLGTAWTVVPGETGTFAGSSLAVLANDQLVVELWASGMPNKTTSYNAVVDYNDANSFLSWTDDVILIGGAPTSVLRVQSIVID